MPTLTLGPFHLRVEKHLAGYTFVEYGCLRKEYGEDAEYYETQEDAKRATEKWLLNEIKQMLVQMEP